MATMRVSVRESIGAGIQRVVFLVYPIPSARGGGRKPDRLQLKHIHNCTQANFNSSNRKWVATISRPRRAIHVVALAFRARPGGDPDHVRLVAKVSRRYPALP